MASSSLQDTANEQARLEALRRYAILDTAPEREFDELAERAARECGYPTALISLMDGQRCWFKASVGLLPPERGMRELPREQTLCNYAFRSSGILVVADATKDERFQRLRIIDRPGSYRAYAGAQIITPDGHSIGTLCLLDTTPRTPTPAQADQLRALATRVMALLETRHRDLAPAPSVSLAPETRIAPPVQVAPPTVSATATRPLVLVVDDEELIRGVTAAMLNRLGCETRLAANGQEALDRLAALGGRVPLILTDIHMPVMNGLELIRAVRRLPHRPPIVVMSGKFTPELKRELHAEGVTELIPKPFGMAEIERALKTAVAVSPK